MGVLSLILGIISIISSFLPIPIDLVGAALAILGIIFGAVARKNPETKGIGTGGLVCSIIGLIMCIAFYVACGACIAGVSNML